MGARRILRRTRLLASNVSKIRIARIITNRFRSSVPVTKVSEPSVDISADRPRAPMTSEVEDFARRKLGRELLDCAHNAIFHSHGAFAEEGEDVRVDIVIRAMSAIVQTLFPSTGLDVFGSYPTRAWVPGSSNLDLSLNLPPEAMIASHPERRMEAFEYARHGVAYESLGARRHRRLRARTDLCCA